MAVVCLAGSAYGLYLLYSDMGQGPGKRSGKPMAVLQKREAKVRMKPASSYIWREINSNDDLYRKESVQTGPASAAIIKLNDGTLLELGENSLVVIDDMNNLALNFLQGSLVMRKATGEDAKISVGKDGKAKVEELQIRLISPESLAKFFVADKTQMPLQFAWQTPKKTADQKPEKHVLQVSTDRAFRPDRTKIFPITSSQKWETTAQLSSGKYFWRVVGDANKVLSETAYFMIDDAIALKPVYPIGGQKITRFGDAAPVQFRWVGAGGGDGNSSFRVGHQLDVATDPEFKNVIINQPIDGMAGSAVPPKGVSEGTVYWRIRSKYGNVSVSSPVEKFVVERTQMMAVDLLSPADSTSLGLQTQMRFSWECDNTQVEFQMELQDMKGKTLVSNKGRSMSYIWATPANGRYKWRVQALQQVGQNTKVVGESQWSAFSIFTGGPLALQTPTKNQDILYWEQPTQFNFSWKKDDLGEQPDYSYQVEVASDAQFTKVVGREKGKAVAVPSAKLGVQPGTYFWRVHVLDPTGKAMKTSDVQRFSYGNPPPLKAPAVARPQSGKVFNLVENNEDPAVNWTAVEGAQSYEVVVHSAENGGRNPAGASKVVKQSTVTGTSLDLKGLPEGKYTWSVRALDKIKRKGEATSSNEFTVTLGQPLAAPEILTPEIQ